MKSIKVSEANQQFSKLIQQMETDGIPIRILRRNKPVAILIPDTGNVKSNQQRQAALDEMCSLHKRGLDLGGLRVNRDDLYDRQ